MLYAFIGTERLRMSVLLALHAVNVNDVKFN